MLASMKFSGYLSRSSTDAHQLFKRRMLGSHQKLISISTIHPRKNTISVYAFNEIAGEQKVESFRMLKENFRDL